MTPSPYIIHAVAEIRESATESARETDDTGRESARESEKERFKSLVKPWDSSRSSYATVQTHRGRNTHIRVHALLSMRHKEGTETNMKQSQTIRHSVRISCRCSSKGTQSRGKEFTVLRSAVGLRTHDHKEPQS